MNEQKNTKEMWRPVLDWPNYFVSNLGRIKSTHKKREKILRPHKVNHGYIGYRLCCEGQVKSFLVHRLMLESFIGRRPQGGQCRHLDGNPQNNNLHNLCWGTPRENALDKRQHGTDNRGERHGKAKLTEAQVRQIKKESIPGIRGQRSTGNAAMIAKKYNITKNYIRNLCNGITWKHLTKHGTVQIGVKCPKEIRVQRAEKK